MDNKSKFPPRNLGAGNPWALVAEQRIRGAEKSAEKAYRLALATNKASALSSRTALLGTKPSDESTASDRPLSLEDRVAELERLVAQLT